MGKKLQNKQTVDLRNDKWTEVSFFSNLFQQDIIWIFFHWFVLLKVVIIVEYIS
jgi:hypothetical protein